MFPEDIRYREQKAKAAKAMRKLEEEEAALKTIQRGWKDETKQIEDAVSCLACCSLDPFLTVEVCREAKWKIFN